MPESTQTFNIEAEGQLETSASPAVKLDEKLKDEILSQIHDEGMVIVHCSCNTDIEGGIRIRTMFTTVAFSL
jgi:hypothetical protein